MVIVMKIAISGTGYVGLVTGICLAEIGHDITCVDIDKEKINSIKEGNIPIYDEKIEELIKKNKDNLKFTTNYKMTYKNNDIIFVCVGTPDRYDGSANTDYVYEVCNQIKESATSDKIIIIKSTVPMGINDDIHKHLNENSDYRFHIVSNPEFLSQGTAIHDMLYPSRIIVGTEDDYSEDMMRKIYEPLTKAPYNAPYLSMSRKSAEMVKYASNDFLALKISYINEIANFCEKIGANIDDVTSGMSYDSRIGDKFLNAGIGYGGSCFPKDTKALHWLSRDLECELKTISSTIDVNKLQKVKLMNKVLEDFKELKGKKVAVLGLSFKPGTDDLREAPSIVNVDMLLEYGAFVNVYDPVALNKFKKLYGNQVNYYQSIDEAITGCDFAMIMTEWDQIVNYDLENYKKLMKRPIIYDGRNCYSLADAKSANLIYYSIGRKYIK